MNQGWQVGKFFGLIIWQKMELRQGFSWAVLGGPIGSAKLGESTKWYHDRAHGTKGHNIYRYIIAFTSQQTPLECTTCLEIDFTE